MINDIIVFAKRIVKDIHFLWTRRTSASYVSFLRSRGINIGQNVHFRHPRHTTIDLTRPSLIQIGSNVDINDYFTIMTHDFGSFVFRNLYGDFVASSGSVAIGNNIYIARNVTILKGVTIGDNCIIGLGSVITKDIPSNSVVCGIPARVVCTLEDYYKKRKNLQVEEAILYGMSLLKRGIEPRITNFTEEWCLFFRESDYEKYPEMHRIIDVRIKNNKDFFKNRKVVFNGFEEFIDIVKIRYSEIQGQNE